MGGFRVEGYIVFRCTAFQMDILLEMSKTAVSMGSGCC